MVKVAGLHSLINVYIEQDSFNLFTAEMFDDNRRTNLVGRNIMFSSWVRSGFFSKMLNDSVALLNLRPRTVPSRVRQKTRCGFRVYHCVGIEVLLQLRSQGT